MSDEFSAKVKKEGDALRTKRDSLADQKTLLAAQVKALEEELIFVNEKISLLEKYENVQALSVPAKSSQVRQQLAQAQEEVKKKP